MQVKSETPYEIVNRGDIRNTHVLVKRRNPHVYTNDVYTRIEVSVTVDLSDLSIERTRWGENWSYRLLRSDDDSLANWQSRDAAAQYIGADAINAAERKVKQNILDLKKAAKRARTNAAWKALQPYADSIIQHYKTDFYHHDALTIDQYDLNRFIWLARETGTWLIYERNDFAAAIMERSKEHRIFLFDRGDLQEITSEKAAAVYATLPERKG